MPGEHAANYQVGANYSGHVVGSGPYKVTIYVPGETVVLDRNPNWDPATDPLRKAWVDRIQIKLDVGTSSIQRAIEREEADLSLDGHVPQARVAALQADPEQSRRLSVHTTGTQLFLVLGTHRGAGAIADVRVRQAVNYAIDKAAYRDAIAGRFAADRRAGLHHPGPGLARLPPLRPVPDPRRPGRPRQGQGAARCGWLPQGADPGLCDLG